MKKVKQFLDYAATHPDAIITYHASNMVLAGHSDASYLSETKACSRAGGHFFMSSDTADPPQQRRCSLNITGDQHCHVLRG